MKRIKYLLQRTKKQKCKQNTNQRVKSQYMQTIKNQAIKSLQDFEQDCLNKTLLNITLRNSQRLVQNKYRSQSQQKQNMRRTHIYPQKQKQVLTTKNNSFRKQTLLQTSSINIKKLLKIKTQSQQQESNKMKNPFYKIQKARLIPKKYSLLYNQTQSNSINQCSQNNQNYRANNKNHNKSLCLKQQKKLNKHTQSQNYFISRDKKQWYFASKKFRSRTVQNDQINSAMNKIQQFNKKQLSIKSFDKSIQIKQKSSRQNHSRQQNSLTQFQNTQILAFKKSDSILNGQQNLIAQASREQSPFKIRQKSLTVKYNEIKDYFEKKYVKNYQEVNDSGIQKYSNQR